MSLNQDVDHIAVLIDGTPEIMPPPSDRDEDLVQIPRIAQTTAASPEAACVLRTELPTPLPDRLVGHDDPALGQEILGISEAQAEAVIKPDGVTDDLGREPVSVVALQSVAYPGSLPGATSS